MSYLGIWILDTVPPLIAMVVMVGAASCLLLAWRARLVAWRTAFSMTATDALLLLALGGIALLTLGQPMGSQPDRINLVPFRDQIWAARGVVDPGLALAMLVGNVALFVPLGVALALRRPRNGAWSLLMVAFGVSVSVEAAQAVMNIGRLADVTDVLANTAGAGMGIMAWRAISGGGRSLRELGIERRS